MSSSENGAPSQKRDFERVDYDIEKTLYPDPPNESFNEMNASHQIEKSMMMHRVPTEPLEEIPSLQKGETPRMNTSIESNPSRNLEEGVSTDDEDGDEEKKQKSKFALFYNRHRVWFQ